MATEPFQSTLRHVEWTQAWKGPGEDVCLMIVRRLTFCLAPPSNKIPAEALKLFMLFVMDVNFLLFRR